MVLKSLMLAYYSYMNKYLLLNILFFLVYVYIFFGYCYNAVEFKNKYVEISILIIQYSIRNDEIFGLE